MFLRTDKNHGVGEFFFSSATLADCRHRSLYFEVVSVSDVTANSKLLYLRVDRENKKKPYEKINEIRTVRAIKV